MKPHNSEGEAMKMVPVELLGRYETLRALCLRYGNYHPDSNAVCYQALQHVRLPMATLMMDLAMFADDAALALAAAGGAQRNDPAPSGDVGARLSADDEEFIISHAKSECAGLRHYGQEATAEVFDKYIALMEAKLAPVAQDNGELVKELRRDVVYWKHQYQSAIGADMQGTGEAAAALSRQPANAAGQEVVAWIGTKRIDNGVGIELEQVLRWDQVDDDDQPLVAQMPGVAG